MTSITIPISLPVPALRPNGQNGRAWAQREAKRKQRAESVTAATMALAGQPPPRWARARYRLHVFAKSRWDDDNLIAALKGARDGLQDAGIVVNDRYLEIAGVTWTRATERMRVEIVVEGIA